MTEFTFRPATCRKALTSRVRLCNALEGSFEESRDE